MADRLCLRLDTPADMILTYRHHKSSVLSLRSALDAHELLDGAGTARAGGGGSLALHQRVRESQRVEVGHLQHPENLHPALVSVLLLVAASLSPRGEGREGVVENLGAGVRVTEGVREVRVIGQESGHIDGYVMIQGRMMRRCLV